jgi:hypothetical protein
MTTIKHNATVKATHDDVIDHIVGMTEEQAIRTLKLNGENNIRIVKKNGEVFIFPMIFWTGVNLIIQNDKVIQATRG